MKLKRLKTQVHEEFSKRWQHYSLLLYFGVLSSCVHSPEPASTQVGYHCQSAASYANRVIGDGHCVSLIKRCSRAPSTAQWRPGAKVLSQAPGSIVPGSIIATFKNGRYPSREGYHAAIYISHSEQGIWVWDQWVGKAVHRRFIRVRNDGAQASNSAQAYRLVR